jgi:hypothetical protein
LLALSARMAPRTAAALPSAPAAAAGLPALPMLLKLARSG